MSLRSLFQNMAAKDSVMIVGSDVSQSFSFRRIDTGSVHTVNGCFSDDTNAVTTIQPIGIGVEDREAIMFIAVSEIATILADRAQKTPIPGDKFTATMGGITTTWTVSSMPRPDDAGGLYVNLKAERTSKVSAPGTRAER